MNQIKNETFKLSLSKDIFNNKAFKQNEVKYAVIIFFRNWLGIYKSWMCEVMDSPTQNKDAYQYSLKPIEVIYHVFGIKVCSKKITRERRLVITK
jgi:hypothetical protein